MGFSGGQGIFEVLGDEIWGATGPGTEISALDRSKKSGRQGDKSTDVKEIGKVLFFLSDFYSYLSILLKQRDR